VRTARSIGRAFSEYAKSCAGQPSQRTRAPWQVRQKNSVSDRGLGYGSPRQATPCSMAPLRRHSPFAKASAQTGKQTDVARTWRQSFFREPRLLRSRSGDANGVSIVREHLHLATCWRRIGWPWVERSAPGATLCQEVRGRSR